MQPEQDPQQYVYGAPAAPQGDPGKLKRLIIGGVGLVIFLGIVLVVLLAIFSTPSIKPELGKVAAVHIEIDRVTALAIKSDRSSRSVKNLAATTQAVARTHSFQLISYADRAFTNGFTKTTLNSLETPAIDAELEAAIQNNSYNEDFIEILTQLLSTANTEISSTFEKSEDQNLNIALGEMFDNNEILLKSID